MRLDERCRSSFSSRVLKRGDHYARYGSVEILDAKSHSIKADVQGSEYDPYRVSIRWEPGDTDSLSASCTCQYFSDGELCKHIWATLIAAGRELNARGPSGGKALTVIPDYRILEGMDEVERDLQKAIAKPAARDGAKKKPKAKKAKTAQKPPSLWRKQLNEVRGQLESPARNRAPSASPPKPYFDAWFGLHVPFSKSAGAPVLQIYVRERKKNGEPGKGRAIEVANRHLLKFENPEDQLLIEDLLGPDHNRAQRASSTYGYGGYSSYYSSYGDRYFGLSSRHCAEMLARLAATERLVRLDGYERPDDITQQLRIRFDAGPPWKARVLLERGDKSGWKLRSELFRDAEARTIERTTVLLDDGLVLFRNEIALAEWGNERELAGELREEVQIPAAELDDFLEKFFQLPGSETVLLPDDIGWTMKSAPPRGHLVVKRDDRFVGNRLRAQLSWDYGTYQVAADEKRTTLADPTGKTYLRRDTGTEELLTQALQRTGFKESVRYGYMYRPNSEKGFDWELANAAKLPAAVVTLSRAGWTIVAEGKLIRQAGVIDIQVTTGIDWFDLSGHVNYGDEQIALPAVLAALHKGQQYVTLSDGSQGMLPEEWLRKYGTLASLGDAASTNGESIRFKPSQAMLLDALLAEQEQAQVDRGFERCREKWRGFGGIQATAAPSGFQGELRHYQQEGLGWLKFLEDFQLGGCLADDMGLGKTVQVLAFLQGRGKTTSGKKSRDRRPTLIVVPKSLVFNWQEEAARFTPELRVLNYTGLQRRGLESQVAEHDLVLTTYGTLRKDIAALKEIEFGYAILDEAQAIKNPTSLSAKACRLIQARHRLVLSGTPVENRLSDLWSLFEFLNPGMLGQSATFQQLAKGSDGRSSAAPQIVQIVPDDRDDEEEDETPLPETDRAPATNGRSLLGQALRPLILRRTKKQVLTELPDRFEQTIHCEMERPQQKIYDEIRDYYRNGLSQRVAKEGWAKAKIHVLEALLRLRQTACHPGLIDKKHAAAPSAKLDALFEKVDELVAEGHKALIFSQFTSLLAIVRAKLDKQGIVYEYLDGKTSDRQARVKRFQTDEKCPLFLLSLKAGGHGLNLTAADYVFILDPWWNPAVEAQAIDRAYRIGQTRNVFAYRLICTGTVEEKILELQKSKRELADAIVSEDNSLLTKMTPEDLQLLLS